LLVLLHQAFLSLCFKASETLLGIETPPSLTSPISISASKPLKPF